MVVNLCNQPVVKRLIGKWEDWVWERGGGIDELNILILQIEHLVCTFKNVWNVNQGKHSSLAVIKVTIRSTKNHAIIMKS